ncbi:MAG: tetratricopeptide repeat protein [Actinoallomurus sp.]
MLSETVAALAGAGGTAVVQAMVSDSWDSTKARMARLLGRGDPTGVATAEKHLECSRAELEAVPEPELEDARRAQAAVWRARLAELLEEDPRAETELRRLVSRVHDTAGATVQSIHASGRRQAVLGAGVQINTFLVPEVREEVAATITVPAGRRYDGSPLRGRDELIDELLAARSGPEPRVRVLHGLGGGGKSSVALEVAYRLQDREVEVWWVPATDADRVTMGMLVLARRLGLTDAQIGHRDVADLVWQRLAARDEPWLLVFDNADDPNVLTVDGAPPADGTGWLRPLRSPAGMVVVTSRHGHQSDWGGWCHLHDVGMLSPAEGAQVLIDGAGSGAGDRTEAEALARRLGGLPLALRLAASYLDQTRQTPTVFADAGGIRTFAQYEAAVDDQRFEVIFPAQHAVRLSDRQARQMIGRTWDLSLDLLERRGVAEARPLLRLLACLADAPVPHELLLRPSSLAASELFPAPMTGGRVWTALRALAGAGLVDLPERSRQAATRRDHVPVLGVHPLVRDTSQPVEDRQRYASAVATLLAAAVRSEESGLPEQPARWPVWQVLVPHALEVLDLLDGVPGAGEDAWRDATQAAYMGARHLAATGAYGQAEAAYGDVLRARERVLGADHPDTLNARYGLARMAAARGRYDDAEAAYRQVLNARERVLGADHPDTLNARYGLARIAAAQGRYAEAEAAYREVLAAEERVLGADHPDTLRARYGIARMVGDQGRYEEAEAIYRALLAVQENLPKADPIGVATPGGLDVTASAAAADVTAGSAGSAAGSGARAATDAAVEAAKTVYREVLAVEERVLGTDRPDRLTTRYAIARMAAAQGRYDLAEVAYREVLAVEETALGADHPDTLTTRHWIARMANALGRREEAEGAFRDVLAAREQVLGHDHPHTLTTRYWIARTMAGLGRRQEAEAAFREVLAARVRVLGDDHPQTRQARQALEEAGGGDQASGRY